MFRLISNTNRVRETYPEHARRCLVSPTLETTSPACRRFSPSGFSVRYPKAAVAMNSPSASRLSSFTLRDPEFNAVYNATADVWHVQRELEVLAREWESLNAKAEVARVHREMMWYRPLEDFGRWQTHAGRELPKGDDPRTDQREGADSNLPGWHPKETAS